MEENIHYNIEESYSMEKTNKYIKQNRFQY